MNKKWIIVIVVAVLLLLGLAFCAINGGDAPAEPTPTPDTVVETPEPTPEPTPTPTPDPEWEAGLSRAAYAEGVYDIFAKGTEVEVVGMFKDYYVVAGEEYDLLVEKRFIRMEGEAAFEAYTGYAYGNSEVFSSVYMRGEPIATLGLNTQLSVLEGKGDWVYVEWAEGEGYMLAKNASKYYIQYYAPSGGGGGGATPSAPADGTDVDIGTLSHKQGRGSIVLLGAYFGPEKEAGFEAGKGLVIADDVEASLLLWQRDDQLKVTECTEETCTIWIEDDIFVELPRWLVRMEGDEEYESWSGYSANGAAVYEEYQLRNEIDSLTRNTELVVLDEIGEGLYSYYHPGCYVVLIDGEICYMALESVGKTPFAAPNYYYGGGGGGGNNNNAGQGDVWTPPAL